MRLFFIALLLAGLCMAFTVTPDYRGIKDSGSEKLPNMTVAITIDCDSKELSINVTDPDEQPIDKAKTYLFYTDYSYQALPNPSQTDSTGIAPMKVPGNIRFLTALFILRVDQPSFRSREIEFTYEKCFEPPPPEPKPKPPPPNKTNETEPKPPLPKPPPNKTEDNKTTVNVTPPSNITPPVNVTQPKPPEKKEAPLCPLGLLLILPLLLKIKK
jgi:hypothetical protein